MFFHVGIILPCSCFLIFHSTPLSSACFDFAPLFQFLSASIVFFSIGTHCDTSLIIVNDKTLRTQYTCCSRYLRAMPAEHGLGCELANATCKWGFGTGQRRHIAWIFLHVCLRHVFHFNKKRAIFWNRSPNLLFMI